MSARDWTPTETALIVVSDILRPFEPAIAWLGGLAVVAGTAWGALEVSRCVRDVHEVTAYLLEAILTGRWRSMANTLAWLAIGGMTYVAWFVGRALWRKMKARRDEQTISKKTLRGYEEER